MSADFLTLDMTYHIDNGRVEISGDVREECRSNLIVEFLRGQIGAGADSRPAIEREQYHIRLKWHPHLDRFEVSDDTGNKGLRDGILYGVLRTLDGK